MNTILTIEMSIVAAIVLLQVVTFLRNQKAVKQLASLYPHAEDLAVQATALVGTAEGKAASALFTDPIDLVEDKESYSPTFRAIVKTTNTYLIRHGNEGNFETLQELAERKATSEEQAIETTIALPLYMGLLGTFSGVIIGLIKIATVGVTDAAIQTFIGGVLIGMIGSATGLALTVWGSQLFKTGKQLLDRHQYDYFSFLQTHLLPAKMPDPQEPLKNLRDHLSAFQQGFVQYQQHINASLGDTLRMYSELKDVFQQIRRMEPGLSSLKDFLEGNEELMHKQVKYFDLYTHKIEQFSHSIEGHMSALTPSQTKAINGVDPQALSAYAKMEHFLGTLTNNDRYAFADALSKDLQDLRGEMAYSQSMSLEVNGRLLERFEQDSQQQSLQSQQIHQLNERFEKMLDLQQQSPLQRPAFQFFLYAGVAAFVLAVASGATYLINAL
jgi:hypothetical protein